MRTHVKNNSKRTNGFPHFSCGIEHYAASSIAICLTQNSALKDTPPRILRVNSKKFNHSKFLSDYRY